MEEIIKGSYGPVNDTDNSDINISMYVIDILRDTYSEIKSNKFIRLGLKKTNTGAKEQLKKIVEYCTNENYVDELNKFTDLTTLDERMKDKNKISVDFIGKISGWCRASFITLERLDEKLSKVIISVDLIKKNNE